jgi:hypothetical protein
MPAQVGEKAAVKRPPGPLRFFKRSRVSFWAWKKGASGWCSRVRHGLKMEKDEVSEDKQQVDRAITLTLADAGSGQMAYEAQHRKPLLHPQIQVGAKLLDRRFDLSLKASNLSVMQSEAPLLWFR